MRDHSLQLDIYYDDTIKCIRWIIIGYGRQYFRQCLIPSEFTGNRMEGKISFPTSTLGFLLNQLSMRIPIRVSCIPGIGYTDTQYIYHSIDKVYGWGVQARGNSQRDTQNRSGDTHKISGRDPKLYTGELFLETLPKLKGAFKSYFEYGYRQLYLT